jgi:hypothetical protein
MALRVLRRPQLRSSLRVKLACAFWLDPDRVGGSPGQSVVGAMIPVPSGVRVWLSVGHTDMRQGMYSLALQVQQGLKRELPCRRSLCFPRQTRSSDKILWHDGIDMSL